MKLLINKRFANQIKRIATEKAAELYPEAKFGKMEAEYNKKFYRRINQPLEFFIWLHVCKLLN